jgi:hypothetical protein
MDGHIEHGGDAHQGQRGRQGREYGFPSRSRGARARARAHGLSCKISPHIGSEVRDRCVAHLRFLAHGLEHDPVEPFGELDGRLAAKRMFAGDDLIQHGAERVNIRGGCQRIAAQLLGTGVLGSHQAAGEARGRLAPVSRSRFEQLGDPEIQQLGLALGGHQNIRRLEVAVDNVIAVGVLHCRTNLQEELQTIFEGQVAAGAIPVDGGPIDVLHDEVGRALRGGATVQQAGDIRVIQVG